MRLIDADKLKAHYAWWNDDYKEIFDSIIDQQPTVEAVEHGHWEEARRDFTLPTGFCSVCGSHQRITNYCPNCGARMDGDEK